jgi:signal transduction histidine kinase
VFVRLTTQTRLIAVLCLIIVVFGVAFWLLRSAHLREGERLLANLQDERGELVQKLVKLTGESLENFANDYSYWDELVRFVGTADPVWARANLEVSLPTFKVHAVWVLAPDGRQVHASLEGAPEALQTLPLPIAELLPALRERRFLHFHQLTQHGLIEFRVAPIQPTADSARNSPPQGWFVVARIWGEEHLTTLRRLLGGNVEVDRAGVAVPVADNLTVRIQHPLPDWRGNAVATLRSDFSPKALALLLSENENEKFLFLTPGIAMIVFFAFALSHWVLRPLQQFEQSFASDTARPLHRLRDAPDVFGRLAQAIESSFEQRRALEREVEERRRVEAALRESEEGLRRAGEIRTRLARDLHDGVIQSIYAAGLGLEGVRNSLNDPPAAARKLDASQASLNQTIREVRAFIHGLEPEETARPDFATALRSLIATLQALHTAKFDLRLDAPRLRLNAREEVHTLQIIRECVSNALRHGQARHITVSLRMGARGGELLIADDGRGFDLAAGRASGGSGLANLASRAAEIGAELDIQSNPGKGTGVTLRFSSRSSHTSAP